MMQFPPGFLDQIRARLTPSQVLGRHLRLQSKPGGEHLALCPFHNDSKPSLTISDRKGFYHCFACGAHGDIITFLTQYKGLSFTDAVTQLAQEAGLPLPSPDPQFTRREQKRRTLFDVTEAATAWFEQQLHSAVGRPALAYLERRGLPETIRKQFRLGYAPDQRQGLKQYLLKEGFTLQQMEDVGLIITPDNGESYDRFRGRVMFPILDMRGRIVAFGGRILGDGEPKYLNSPETELFHKGRQLYGLHAARDQAYREKTLIVVEGYMDALALYRAGFPYAVAPLGTAVTEDQLQIMWQIVPEPILCFDGDTAGQRAMMRAAERAIPLLEPGRSLRFLTLPSGKDPDDVLQEYGPSYFRELLNQPLPLGETLFETTLRQMHPKTPEQRAAFEQTLMGFAEMIRHATVRQHYQRFFRDRLWQWQRQIQGKNTSTTLRNPKILDTSRRTISPRDRVEHRLMALVLEHPSLLVQPEIEDTFMQLELQHPTIRALHDRLLMLISSNTLPGSTDSILNKIRESDGSSEISHLEREGFLSLSCTPGSEKANWEYLIACYEHMRMEEEYQEVVARESASNAEQVFAMKQELDRCARKLAVTKDALEMILEG
ncbi:MAG: DNA primase [Hyphomicrobiales bacterium]|nr:DNA primase [Hyphomicrobiales bacterium]